MHSLHTQSLCSMLVLAKDSVQTKDELFMCEMKLQSVLPDRVCRESHVDDQEYLYVSYWKSGNLTINSGINCSASSAYVVCPIEEHSSSSTEAVV